MAEIGILLTNLGTPAAPTTKAIRRYLAEFLSDPKVITLPKLLWLPILYGFILPSRPRSIVKAYQKIWTEHGSPLLVTSQKIVGLLQNELLQKLPSVKVILGMSYGQPSLAAALTELRSLAITRLLVLPLYPQYASATTGSTHAAVFDNLKTWQVLPELRTVCQYAANTTYINALVDSINTHWQNNKKGQILLFSFHGLPEKSRLQGDPYYELCHKTAAATAKALDLKSSSWQVVFQSRFGRQAWLQPYCDEVLQKLPLTGCDSVDIICPGFAVDCLETLEEINIRYRELFINVGGKNFNYIPALNTDTMHIAALANIILQHTAGW